MTLLIGVLIVSSCQKSEREPAFIEKPKEFTSCPPNLVCDYQVSIPDNQGNQVCYYSTLDTLVKCKQSPSILTTYYGPRGLVSALSIKVPANSTEFTLNTEDIWKGLIQFARYHNQCIQTIPLQLKPISAIVTGKKAMHPISGHSRWLIDAEVVLAEIATNRVVDTLQVRQYFDTFFMY